MLNPSGSALTPRPNPHSLFKQGGAAIRLKPNSNLLATSDRLSHHQNQHHTELNESSTVILGSGVEAVCNNTEPDYLPHQKSVVQQSSRNLKSASMAHLSNSCAGGAANGTDGSASV